MTKAALAKHIDAVLKPLGFARKSGTWSRASRPFIDIVHLQKSTFSDRVTINAGVLHSQIYLKCWGKEAPEDLDEPEGQVRARIGQLIDGRDSWWQLSDPNVATDIQSKLVEYVTPFLERMHSLKAMEEFLANSEDTKRAIPLPTIQLAIIKYELGDKAGASSLLSALAKKSNKGWQERINEVIGRLT